MKLEDSNNLQPPSFQRKNPNFNPSAEPSKRAETAEQVTHPLR